MYIIMYFACARYFAVTAAVNVHHMHGTFGSDFYLVAWKIWF